MKVLADELRRGMEYNIVYKGHRGGDYGLVGGKTLRFRNKTRSGVPQYPLVLNFVEDSDPNARYVIPVFRTNFTDVDERYDFYQTYTGPMAAGHGPNAGLMPENRRAAAPAAAPAPAPQQLPAPAPVPVRAQAAAPRGNEPIGGRRKARKTRRSRRRGSRKVRR